MRCRADDTLGVQFAPRYDRRILDAVRALDDRTRPIAETCRRVGDVAGRLNLPRPSYVHLRRMIQTERARRDAIRAVVDDVVDRTVAGRFVDPYEVADRLRDARAFRR
jgi:predicted transcriptional regulator